MLQKPFLARALAKASFCLLLSFVINGSPLFATDAKCQLFYDESIAQVQFGIEEIKAELQAQKATAHSYSVKSYSRSTGTYSIVVSCAKEESDELCKEFGTTLPGSRIAQSYSIRIKRADGKTGIAVLAADANGAMYGALDVAEAIKLKTIAALENYDKEPYVDQRGIKFNITLDMRSRTYSDLNDANQQNIPEMWSMDFWREMLDEMARSRYNVISLWNMHPFPSLVKVPEFPDIALQDVWRKTSAKDGVKIQRSNAAPLYPNDEYEVIRKISIDEKIDFWRQVMQYGKDRGITFYWYTWNIFTQGTYGKYGISDNQDNETSIKYIRASVREMVRTYPLLGGIGVTAGENMADMKGEYAKEKWTWKTYGEGIRDALKEQPERHFRMTHRFHGAKQDKILEAWKDYPSELDVSFKYICSHMYSDTKSIFIKPTLKELDPKLKLWAEVRNEDVYSFRWGDPDFAREFIRNFPSKKQFAGFNMGPDGYCWGREFLSTEPETPRQLVLKKQWYSFAIWGRLSFDPALENSHFEKLLAARFPQVSSAKLYQASCEASKIFPEITRLYWGFSDYRWFPEACVNRAGFVTIQHFIKRVSMPGTNNINIQLWRDKKIAGEEINEKTPLEVAASLKNYATNTLKLLAELRQVSHTDKELCLTLGDLEAFAHLGNYYAEKVIGASNIALYDVTMNKAEQAGAIKHLEKALVHWDAYAKIYTKQYVQPVRYGRVCQSGLVDIPGDLRNQVAKDIVMAKNWKPGTIRGPLEND
jgi:hypothetical protein